MFIPFPRLFFTVVGLASMTLLVSAQDKKSSSDALSLSATHGSVDKADKESVTIKPRGPDGKFQKELVLKVTGTTKVTTLSPQKRGDKVVLTQREIEAKDLESGQSIAVIYTEAGKEGMVLLSGVVLPASGK